MRWAERLARLSTPSVDSADSVDSPPERCFSEDTPLSIAPIVSLAFPNDTNDPFGKGVGKEKQSAAEAANDAGRTMPCAACLPAVPLGCDAAAAKPAPAGLPLAEIIRLIDAIAGASPIVAPGTLRHGIATMLAAGHGRGETLQTLLPALPLGCDAEAVRIAAWDGETPPIEAGRP